MKISGLIIAALLTPLLLACSVTDALPTQTEVLRELPIASRSSSPTLTATSTTRTFPTPTGRVFPPTPTDVGPFVVPESNSSIFAYGGSGRIKLASSDGELSLPVVTGMESYDMASADETFAYISRPPGRASGETLWIIRPNSAPQALLTLENLPTFSLIAISQNGAQIAYSLYGWGGSNTEDWYEQLWVVGSDGSNNRLIADRTGDSIVDPGPFRLDPIAWSEDLSSVYMLTGTDSESTPTGLYIADLQTGEIRKAKTPQETLWQVAFNEDRSRIVYSSFQWVPVEIGFPEPGPPFAIKVTELATGSTRVVWESEHEFVSNPVWAPDETAIAFSKNRNELATVDLNTGELKIVILGDAEEFLEPRSWLSDGRIVYTEGPAYGDERLMSVRADGSEPVVINSVDRVRVLGELRSSTTP